MIAHKGVGAKSRPFELSIVYNELPKEGPGVDQEQACIGWNPKNFRVQDGISESAVNRRFYGRQASLIPKNGVYMQSIEYDDDTSLRCMMFLADLPDGKRYEKPCGRRIFGGCRIPACYGVSTW